MSKALRKLSALQKCCCMLLARRHQCTTENGYFHTPVMLQEVIQSLGIQQGQTFVDLTFGAGGHTKHILAAAKGVRVFALDRDPIAYRRAQDMAKQYPAGRLVPLLGRFSELGPLLERHGVSPGSLDGALIDCGCSSMQMDDPQRGFGLAHQGPLDMRMDAARFPDEPTAADVVNSLDYDSLVQVLKLYGEEKRAKKTSTYVDWDAAAFARKKVKLQETKKSRTARMHIKIIEMFPNFKAVLLWCLVKAQGEDEFILPKVKFFSGTASVYSAGTTDFILLRTRALTEVIGITEWGGFFDDGLSLRRQWAWRHCDERTDKLSFVFYTGGASS